MTVAELLERISSYELTEWMAFYEIRRKKEEEAQKEAERKARAGRAGKRRR